MDQGKEYMIMIENSERSTASFAGELVLRNFYGIVLWASNAYHL